jgi:hypothetical protein
VAELLARISSAELAEWRAFKRIEAEDEEAARAADGQQAATGITGGLGGT